MIKLKYLINKISIILLLTGVILGCISALILTQVSDEVTEDSVVHEGNTVTLKTNVLSSEEIQQNMGQRRIVFCLLAWGFAIEGLGLIIQLFNKY